MRNKPILSLVLLLAAGAASAQTVVVNARMGGYAYNSPYNRLYNQRTQITFTGKVTGVQRVVPMKGMLEGTTLLVKSANGGTSIVDLGPTWYVQNQKTHVNVGDKVTVVGSKVIVDGRGVILAKMVKKGLDVLALRRPNGAPYWDIAAPVAAVTPDPNVYEITGTVDRFINIGNGPDISSGVVLQTNNGYTTIDLGPNWFYQPQGFEFSPGSNLTVVTRGTVALNSNGAPVPAYWIQYNNNWYQFRNANGQGMWQPITRP